MENELKDVLENAEQKAESVGTGSVESATETLVKAAAKAEEQKAERRARTVKGVHLLEPIMKRYTDAGLTVKPKTGFEQVSSGNGNGRKAYVAKKGGRVDFSGFTVDGPAIIQISEADAKAKHLGRVRGQIDFDCSDDEILAAVDRSIALLQEVVEKPAKATKPAEPAPEATVVAAESK
jgi:hypothetical protein